MGNLSCLVYTTLIVAGVAATCSRHSLSFNFSSLLFCTVDARERDSSSCAAH